MGTSGNEAGSAWARLNTLLLPMSHANILYRCVDDGASGGTFATQDEGIAYTHAHTRARSERGIYDP